MNWQLELPVGTVLKSKLCSICYRVTGEPRHDPKQGWVWPCVFHPYGVLEHQIDLSEMQEWFEVVS